MYRVDSLEQQHHEFCFVHKEAADVDKAKQHCIVAPSIIGMHFCKHSRALAFLLCKDRHCCICPLFYTSINPVAIPVSCIHKHYISLTAGTD
jgi:hypothetical protein